MTITDRSDTPQTADSPRAAEMPPAMLRPVRPGDFEGPVEVALLAPRAGRIELRSAEMPGSLYLGLTENEPTSRVTVFYELGFSLKPEEVEAEAEAMEQLAIEATSAAKELRARAAELRARRTRRG
ncbi:hypothetical protein HNP84_007357 [Thermocatellispora tengchongensis]|uniref:Uncharacterized protein n=1 Tax=Thermocatellispora tengchongensis TaxID=1073253 RepID=A0A840PNK1_9ACTN|nr:hypothetical protein [Thermocatellispora tengchongensis]MBB5137605.1 hypothetical protein [Thermocatellispora tengchongensis]